jgi:hypothetical protein
MSSICCRKRVFASSLQKKENNWKASCSSEIIIRESIDEKTSRLTNKRISAE